MAGIYNVSAASIEGSAISLKSLQTPQAIWILLTIYLGLVVLLGLLGNILVLHASLGHGDLRLDSPSLIFVHNIAAWDVLSIFFLFLPMFTTALYRRWTLGKGLCWVIGFFKSTCVVNEFLTVLAMSGTSLLLIFLICS